MILMRTMMPGRLRASPVKKRRYGVGEKRALTDNLSAEGSSSSGSRSSAGAISQLHFVSFEDTREYAYSMRAEQPEELVKRGEKEWRSCENWERDGKPRGDGGGLRAISASVEGYEWFRTTIRRRRPRRGSSGSTRPRFGQPVPTSLPSTASWPPRP